MFAMLSVGVEIREIRATSHSGREGQGENGSTRPRAPGSESLGVTAVTKPVVDSISMWVQLYLASWSWEAPGPSRADTAG